MGFDAQKGNLGLMKKISSHCWFAWAYTSACTLFCVVVLGSCSTPKVEMRRVFPAETYQETGGDETRPFVRGSGQLAVASQGRFCTQAAVDISAAGGNAVDAAVAMSFVISVERPFSSGLGGGGFWLMNIPQPDGSQKVEAWDFRERAPGAAHSKMFLNLRTGEPDKMRSRRGPLAVGVPGLVAGLYQIHKKYGKLPWARVVRPALDLASKGFPIYPRLAQELENAKDSLSKDPVSSEIFFNDDGEVWKEGELLVQNDLARVLSQISEDGDKSFYRGWIAKRIVSDLRSRGGTHTLADFRDYKVKLRKPVMGRIGAYEVYSMPPPSSGGTHMLQILNTLKNDSIKKWGTMDARTVHLMASSMQKAFVDRAEYMADPDFVKVPYTQLSSDAYARGVREKIAEDRAMKSEEWTPGPVSFPKESDDTIHFSLIGSGGMAISSTQTINGLFGAHFAADGTGIMMNNEMDDFSAAIGATNLFGATASSTANLVEPGKTPLSSMTPTIVFKSGQPVIAVGTPAGTRILTCVAQVLANRLLHGLSPLESVAQIRYHHQASPDEIRVDNPGFPEELKNELTKMGYSIRQKNLGCRIQYVERDYTKSVFTAVSDPRGESWTALDGEALPWNE
jgi:gamma-glutamyltranspeptidase/glutathione hydrolase